ncbi:conserved hypothetical protein [Planktothrix sp. PCC 11201]|uniref:hypothetical protein n=1 Tax=Planktothrix sp. PCC 11201 TaxID=1729650 RepID=UPI0009206049|nr:hypothetical protein [Planktothrix sp. PCC 11201]SKB13714.1 conserved hypothetical protein [Planktothrix sp. PCC 11201]
MDSQQDKIKDREALENAYTNFVEPHVNQLIEIDAQSLPTIPVVHSGFYCVSGWLLLTLLYCFWMRWRTESHLEPKTKNNIRY